MPIKQLTIKQLEEANAKLRKDVGKELDAICEKYDILIEDIICIAEEKRG